MTMLEAVNSIPINLLRIEIQLNDKLITTLLPAQIKSKPIFHFIVIQYHQLQFIVYFAHNAVCKLYIFFLIFKTPYG